MRLPNHIDTITGLQFDFNHPVIQLEDVAYGLARVCRFAGHVNSEWYSVAEHSVLVSNIVGEIVPSRALAALWHDGHEAYMGDMATPLKRLVGSAYEDIAKRIDVAICKYLEIDSDPPPMRHPVIRHADELAVMYEASVLKPGDGWEFTRRMEHREARAVHGSLGLAPAAAAQLFRATHYKLLGA